ncbi:hypothetical protein WR25_22874 [Diploscapter pachys]|uniref:RRM domain-containing protein n=1 Tax=Diploscapter pachys TaxID=2018661 RepID=A0A2A2L3A5_9BILA|nr:hypothetical protein WR25_22874 [Diploscapter pachys]
MSRFTNTDKRRRSKSRSRERRRRSRSKSRDRRRRSRSRSRDRRRRSRSRSRERPRVIDHRDRRPSPIRGGGRLPGPERRDVMPFTAKRSPPKNAKMELTPEERDQRTVFIMQMARSTRPRDLEDFFSSVGAVRDVRIITDSRTGRSKGIAYIEFWNEDSVNLAIALQGQRLLGAPLVIQRTCAERNRAANAAATVGMNLGFGPAPSKGPCKVKVENLHPKITDKMLSEVFNPFGRLEKCEVDTDRNGDGKGTALVVFRSAEDATKAVEQLNGFDLAGKNIKLQIVDDERESKLKEEPIDERQGVTMGQSGRQQLMAKLAQGVGQGSMEMEEVQQPSVPESNIPAIATQCFMLSNMFDPTQENESGWDLDVRDDVIEECAKNGGAVHVYVDKASPQGNVYVKCPSVMSAHKSVTALHGRWFSGKVITANYVPVNSYHELFPDAATCRISLGFPNPYGAMQVPMMPPQIPPGMPPGMPPYHGYGY